MELFLGYLIMTIVMSVIRITVWYTFPKFIRELVFSVPSLAFLADVAGSMFIVKLAGAGSFIGACNLTASVIFGIYVYYYCLRHNIRGLCIKFVKIWKIPVLPYVGIRRI